MTEPQSSPPRRYSPSEIALILEQAGAAQDLAQDTAPTSSLEHADGLTLAQLQEIGTDVGIAPEFVLRAARAVERGDLVPTHRRTWLGMPIGVSRTVDLGRTVSDDEWDRIVVTLRETFEARGRLQRDGAFRQWTNGNLQALLEPTASGHRLRLSTRKGDVTARVWLSGMAVATATLVGSVVMARGGAADVGALVAVMSMGLVGAGSLLSMRFQLPRWARTRAAQMEQIAASTLDAERHVPSAG